MNRTDKNVLKQRLKEEKIQRKTVSFYRYVNIKDPKGFVTNCFSDGQAGRFGRILSRGRRYQRANERAREYLDSFVNSLYANTYFKDVPFKHAVDGNGKSFYKLIVKVRDKVVSDGINDPTPILPTPEPI